MFYLIDGYNLLYAMGALRGRAGPTGLEKARRRLLGFLAGAHGAEAGRVSVIFDAAAAPPGVSAEQDYLGLHVRFAIHEAQADDLIEDLIRHASAPKNLTVVSDDHRIQQAARRRQCLVLGCQDYLEAIQRKRGSQANPQPQTPGKPERLSPDETDHWLREFRELADDPAMKELTDPYRFGEEE